MEFSFIPKYILNKVTNDDALKIHYNILFSNILIIIFIFGGGISVINMISHFCLMDYILGLPCPGCEITMGIVELKTMKNISLAPLLIFIIIIIQIPIRVIAIFNNNYSISIIKISKYLSNIVIFVLFYSYFIKIINL